MLIDWLSKLVFLIFFSIQQKFIEQLPSAEHCATFRENTIECLTLYVCVLISSAVILPFTLSALKKLTLDCHMYEGPQHCWGLCLSKCCLVNCFLMYVCSLWVLSGLWKVFIQKGESSSCPLLLSLLWASFPREGSFSLYVAKRRMRYVSSQIHVASQRASATHCYWMRWTWGRVRGPLLREIGHDLPLARVRHAWLEVIDISELENVGFGETFFCLPVPGKERFDLVVGRSTMCIVYWEELRRSSIYDPCLPLWMWDNNSNYDVVCSMAETQIF